MPEKRLHRRAAALHKHLYGKRHPKDGPLPTQKAPLKQLMDSLHRLAEAYQQAGLSAEKALTAFEKVTVDLKRAVRLAKEQADRENYERQRDWVVNLLASHESGGYIEPTLSGRFHARGPAQFGQTRTTCMEGGFDRGQREVHNYQIQAMRASFDLSALEERVAALSGDVAQEIAQKMEDRALRAFEVGREMGRGRLYGDVQQILGMDVVVLDSVPEGTAILVSPEFHGTITGRLASTPRDRVNPHSNRPLNPDAQIRGFRRR